MEGGFGLPTLTIKVDRRIKMGRTRFNGPVKSTSGFEVGAAASGMTAETNTSVINSAGAVRHILTVKITDISTAGSTFVVSPWAGTISAIYSTIKNAITVADATLSFKLGGTVITGGGITIATAASAAGDVDSSTPTALNTVTAGQAIECITDGGSTTACEAVISIVIDPA